MKKSYPELEKALFTMLDTIEHGVQSSGYQGKPIRMYLGGGMAVNYYCGTRYTEDVDASFSLPLVLKHEDLMVDYQTQQGKKTCLFFDHNYNLSFSIMSKGYQDHAVPWEGLHTTDRRVHLYILSPLDLALSKIARFGAQDRKDIQSLFKEGFFTAETFTQHVEQALSYYIGNIQSVRTSIDLISQDFQQIARQRNRPPVP